MSEFRSYLLAERRLLRFCVRISLSAFRLSCKAARAVMSGAQRRFSLVFVSHDDHPVHQVSFSVGSVVAVSSIFLFAVIFVPTLGARSSVDRTELNTVSSELNGVKTQRESLRKEIGALESSAKDLERTLTKIDSTLPADSGRRTENVKKASFSFFGFIERRGSDDPDYKSLTNLRQSLENSTANLAEAGNALHNMKESLSLVPIRWPLQGGIGHVSMPFGTNPNPFSGAEYLHRGVDISTYGSGDPIIATADGVVLAAGYDTESGYGNNVIIKHRYGYITRYGHMLSYRVRTGQKVKQGDVIGYLGNTGRSTGPHVHYEMQLGPRLLDPIPMVFKPNQS